MFHFVVKSILARASSVVKQELSSKGYKAKVDNYSAGKGKL
jgi:hypothetical protein